MRKGYELTKALEECRELHQRGPELAADGFDAF